MCLTGGSAWWGERLGEEGVSSPRWMGLSARVLADALAELVFLEAALLPVKTGMCGLLGGRGVG